MEGSVTQCLCLLVSVLKHQKYTAAPRNILGGLFLPAAEPRRNQLKFRTEINWQELELFTGASQHHTSPRPRQLSEYERLFEIFRFHRRKLTAIKIRRHWTRGTRRPARRILMCLKMCEWAWQILSDCGWPMRVGAIELGPKQNSEHNYLYKMRK